MDVIISVGLALAAPVWGTLAISCMKRLLRTEIDREVLELAARMRS